MRLMATDNGQQNRGYGAGRQSPLGLSGTIAVHALAVGAFLLIPKEVIDHVRHTPPIITYSVPDDPPPPEVAPEAQADPRVPATPQPQRPTAPEPEVAMPGGDRMTGGGPDTTIRPGPTIILPPADPPPAPILTDPSIDPRALSAFQPDYPGAMIRLGQEGAVTVRVTISPEGRVTDIEKVSASDERFWLATQRHALRTWRFRPATRDGVPISATKVLTVRFTLTDR